MRVRELQVAQELRPPFSPLAPPGEEDVMDALSNVIDPELGLDFVELGLVYEIEVDGGEVNITFTLTSPGCPDPFDKRDARRSFNRSRPMCTSIKWPVPTS